MADKNSSELKDKIKQTEQAVTSVAEILGDHLKKSPPDAGSMPVPSPAAAPHNHPPNPQETNAPDSESETDELQEAWLASLDLKTNHLNDCLEKIQGSLKELSQNVESLEADARIKHAEADGKLADNALRKEMADRTYGFMVIWCFFIGMLMACYMVAWDGKPPLEFMLGVLGTCTISIIGLVGFVVSGLFKAPAKADSK